MLLLALVLNQLDLGSSATDVKACMANYYISREFGSSPSMIGPLTPEDEAWFKSPTGCNLLGAELGNANNRQCSNICSNTACKVGGFQISALQTAAKLGGFTFTLDAMPATDKDGNIATTAEAITQTYTALKHLKPSGPCDLWVSPFFMTTSRLRLGFQFAAPLAPAHLQLVRTTVKQQLAVDQSPVLEGFKLYTVKVFTGWVWLALLGLYLLTRIMIYILEIRAAGGETWTRLAGPIYVPKKFLQVLLHVHTDKRKMSAYLLCLFTLFLFVVALIYEAKMTDVLLTSHRNSKHKIENEEQCLTRDSCCYSVELFDNILSDADVRYKGMLKLVPGGEKQLWEQVKSGTCLAGLTTSTRLAKAYRSDVGLCGALEPVPSGNGLFSNFEAVPLNTAFALNQAAPNAQNILKLVNKGLGESYSYAYANRGNSILGNYNQYFQKTSTCAEEQTLAQAKTSEQALSVGTFVIPIIILVFIMLLTFFCNFCRCLARPVEDDIPDEDEEEEYGALAEDEDEASRG